MATQSTRWLMWNRSHVRKVLLLGAMVLALVGGAAVSRAARPQAAHAAASVVQVTNRIWAGNIAIGNGYQWVSWKQKGLRFCAVSDANADDLTALRNLLSR